MLASAPRNHGAGRNDPARRQSTLIGPLKQTPVAPFAKKEPVARHVGRINACT